LKNFLIFLILMIFSIIYTHSKLIPVNDKENAKNYLIFAKLPYCHNETMKKENFEILNYFTHTKIYEKISVKVLDDSNL
jgi:hypothetical protein